MRPTLMLAAAVAPLLMGAAAPGPTVTLLTRDTRTMTGQPIIVPQDANQVTISIVEIPVGGVLPMHRHPWPRYAYVQQGEIEVHYEGSEPKISRAGEAVIEAVGQWHEGRTVGEVPVRLIVFDQAPAGKENVVRR